MRKFTMSRRLIRFCSAVALTFAWSMPSYALQGMLPQNNGSDTYVPQSNYKIPVPENIMVGKQAPDFEAVSSEGQTIRLSDFKGKIIVLEWHNPECPFVKKHYDSNNMQTLQHYARGEGLVWLTINSSGEGKEGYMEPPQAQAYYEKHHMYSNHYLLDPLGKIGRSYDAKTTPNMFIIDAGGYIAYSGAIDNKASADPNDIPLARNYVQSAIENLLMGKPASPYATQPYGCPIKYRARW